MPGAVPIIQDSADLQIGTGRRQVNASPEAYGLAGARGLVQLSQGVEALGQAAEKIDQQLDEANVNDLDIQYTKFERDQFHNPETGYLAKQGKAALEDRMPLQQRLGDQIAEIAKSARSDRARKAFLDLAARRSGDAYTRADAYAQDQFRVYEDQTFQARADEASESLIAGFTDPGVRAKSEATLRSILGDIATRKGVSPETAENAIRKTVSGAYGAAIELQIHNNPYATKKELENPEGWGAKLDAETKAKLIIQADNEIERRAAKYRAQISDSASNAMDMMAMGIPVPNKPSVEQVRSALGIGAALKYDIAIKSADFQTTMHKTPTDDLIRIATAPDMIPKGPEDYEAFKLQKAQKQAALDNVGRRQNSMQYLLDTGLAQEGGGTVMRSPGPSPAPLPMEAIQKGDWDGLAAGLKPRKAATETIGRELGLPPAPLTDAEAIALGGQLSAMGPDEKFAALKTIARGMGGDNSDAYRGLMRQIGGASAPNIGFAGALSGKPSAVLKTNAHPDYSAEQAAQLLLLGQSLLSPTKGDKEADPGAKIAMPSDDQLRKVWSEWVGNAFADDSGTEKGSFGAYKAFYAALTSKSKDASGANNEVDDKRAMLAANLATGGVANIYERKTIVPWGMEPSRVQAQIEATKPGEARPTWMTFYGLPGKPSQYQYRLTSKPNTYIVLSGDAPVLTEKGPVFVRVHEGPK